MRTVAGSTNVPGAAAISRGSGTIAGIAGAADGRTPGPRRASAKPIASAAMARIVVASARPPIAARHSPDDADGPSAAACS